MDKSFLLLFFKKEGLSFLSPRRACMARDALPNPIPRPDWLARHTEPAIDPERPIVDAHHHLWDVLHRKRCSGAILPLLP